MIQGGDCYAVIQQLGTCRTCGAPWGDERLECRREWNRQNVALVRLLGNSEMKKMHWYALSITIFNPHITNSFQVDPRHWNLESFLGNPWPVYQPYGYDLDLMNVTGYKISELADFSIEEPADKNGSAHISNMRFSMKFSEKMPPIEPGDYIVLRAPSGYETSRLILGLVNRIVCMGFSYLPAEYRKVNKTEDPGVPQEPPERDPIPELYPLWRSNAARLSSAEIEDVNDTNQTIWEDYNFTVTRQHCFEDMYDDNTSNIWNMSGGLNWTDFSPGTVFNISLERLNETEFGPDRMLFCLLARCPECTEDAVLCMEMNANQVPPGAVVLAVRILSQSPEVMEMSDDERKAREVDLQKKMRMKRRLEEVDNNTNGSNASNGSNGSNGTNVSSKTLEEQLAEEQEEEEERPAPCLGLAFEVVWGTSENLTAHLEEWRIRREAALYIWNWDRYPLQAKPICGEPSTREITWRVGEEDIHPDGSKMLNGTTINFLLSYKNPRRPPQWHENFWTVRHYSNGSESGEMEVSSSAAVQSWTIFSKLRWVKVLLMSEVLQPTDTATFHFEFVTVNLADTLIIRAMSPEGFDFTDAVINNPPDPPEARRLEGERFTHGSRRLLWQGFTKNMVMKSTSVEEMIIGFDVARIEYVRFRVEGIRIPWEGGQALFTFFSEWEGRPADEMQNCCYPGYPPDNPAVVFQVPFRLTTIIGSILNLYQQDPLLYPIESAWETRFDEMCRLSFTFQVPVPHRPVVDDGLIVIVLRSPPGYEIIPKDYIVADATQCLLDAGGTCGLTPRKLDLIRSKYNRIEIGLPGLEVMEMGIDFQITVSVRTPLSLHDRTNGSAALWVLELSDAYALGQGWSSTTLGAPRDFILLNSVNFSVAAERSPPETLITVEVTFNFVGEIQPTVVEVYAPEGYAFLPNCLEPGQDDLLESTIVSCRERQTIFGATYLSGAVMMTVNGGIPPEELPFKVRLLVKTPPFTPARMNKWFVRGGTRFGPVSWGVDAEPFPVIHMQALIAYAAISGVRASAFTRLVIRYELEWGYHLHIAGPRTYKLYCPVTKVLTGLESPPACKEEDPLLAGCWGLPPVGDPRAKALGLPVCDPQHELLLTFNRPPLPEPPPGLNQSAKEAFLAGAEAELNGRPVVPPGGGILMALELQVPMETPTPRKENVFQFRILDMSKNVVDGKLNAYGPNVIDRPIVSNLKLWWTDSVPNALATIAIQFDFNNSLGSPVKVIDIMAPEGVSTAIRRPSDVKQLIDPSLGVPIMNWSWSNILPRHLWFSLDENEPNFTAKFHYGWPVMTPTKEVGMPTNNLWQVMLCGDQPYCDTLVLDVPIPGFFFGELPDFDLSEEEVARLTGSFGIRSQPTWLLTAGLVAWLFALQSVFAEHVE